jgi:hypothetical protein
MLLRRGVIEKVGLFDEIYQFGYFDETDYCKRAEEKGLARALAKAAYVYHVGGQSFKRLKGSEELFRKNEEIFFKRWGRPVRVGYFVDRQGGGDKVNDLATQVARSGHQMLVFLRKGLRWPVSLDHYEIRRFDLSPTFFGLASLYTILKRKRKKKVEVLLTDNRLFGAALKALSIAHGSHVIVNPERDALLEVLRQRSTRT